MLSKAHVKRIQERAQHSSLLFPCTSSRASFTISPCFTGMRRVCLPPRHRDRYCIDTHSWSWADSSLKQMVKIQVSRVDPTECVSQSGIKHFFVFIARGKFARNLLLNVSRMSF